MIKTLPASFIFVMISLALASCGSGLPNPQPVHGKVMVGNHPAMGAFVVFHPDDGDERMQSLRPNGRVGEDGSFRLTTFHFGDGAPPGRYRVAIEWPGSASTNSSSSEETSGGSDRLAGRFGNPETSGFEVEIAVGNNELPPFDVTSALH